MDDDAGALGVTLFTPRPDDRDDVLALGVGLVGDPDRNVATASPSNTPGRTTGRCRTSAHRRVRGIAGSGRCPGASRRARTHGRRGTRRRCPSLVGGRPGRPSRTRCRPRRSASPAWWSSARRTSLTGSGSLAPQEHLIEACIERLRDLGTTNSSPHRTQVGISKSSW